MNKEILNEQLTNLEARNPGLEIIGPRELQPQETTNKLIELLQAIYVEHGITNDEERLINDIANGDVLTWFAKKHGRFIATASLVKQSDGAWELGRAVSLDRGNGIGKKIILEALRFHIDNHGDAALTAEIRAAAEFEGIPSGLATQKIFFKTVNEILPITPFAVAPLFAHGEPLRNEPFILSASDVKPGKTISEKISEVINGRSTEGFVTRLNVIRNDPFTLAIPDNNGPSADHVLHESELSPNCTLIPVEATDRNMPLIGKLMNHPDVVLCGVDRLIGREGKPVILAAMMGFVESSQGSSTTVLLAPAIISDAVPADLRLDMQKIADRFIQNRINKIEGWNDTRRRLSTVKDWGY